MNRSFNDQPRKRTLTLLAALLASLAALHAAVETPDSPHIAFILADDLGSMDSGANHAKTFYETPNIYVLAAKGMRFKQGYAACPACRCGRSCKTARKKKP